VRAFDSNANYDVFLSHSYDDAEVILGVKRIIESSGLKVYVDWIDDPSLDRERVSTKTAEVLRTRMAASACLVYAHSPNTSESKWMPWELGYFDSLRPRHVWILPLVETYNSEFSGQEYLGLYPKLETMQGILGFTKVAPNGTFIPLSRAARGEGVYLEAA
jgi:hypothetical protein